MFDTMKVTYESLSALTSQMAHIMQSNFQRRFLRAANVDEATINSTL